MIRIDRSCVLSRMSKRFQMLPFRGSTQGKSASKIFRFCYKKTANDPAVAGEFRTDHFAAAACFAHCQNFSAAGLSRPFSATMPTEIGFGSGVMCKLRGQRAEVTGQRPDSLSDEKP